MIEENFIDVMTENNITLSYGKDGILYIYVASDEFPISQVETQKSISKTIGVITKGKKVPVLVEYADFVLPNEESRKYWAKEDSSPYSLAEAFITHSVALRLIGNVYLHINKPTRPTKIFSDKNLAQKWLNSFIEK